MMSWIPSVGLESPRVVGDAVGDVVGCVVGARSPQIPGSQREYQCYNKSSCRPSFSAEQSSHFHNRPFAVGRSEGSPLNSSFPLGAHTEFRIQPPPHDARPLTKVDLHGSTTTMSRNDSPPGPPVSFGGEPYILDPL
jgi:hypothetical protein